MMLADLPISVVLWLGVLIGSLARMCDEDTRRSWHFAKAPRSHTHHVSQLPNEIEDSIPPRKTPRPPVRTYGTQFYIAPPERCAMTFSRDGKLLAAPGADGIPIIWDIETRRPRSTAPRNINVGNGLTFSPDGKSLVIATPENNVYIWPIDAKQGEYLFPSGDVEANSVTSIGMSIAGLLAVATDNGRVSVWEFATRKRKYSIPVGDMTLNSHPTVAFSPDGRLLSCGTLIATEDADGQIYIVESSTGKRSGSLSSNVDSILGMSYSPDGALLTSLTMTYDWSPIPKSAGTSRAELWNVAESRLLASYTARAGILSSCSFSVDRRSIAVGGTAGVAEVLSVKDLSRIAVLAPQMKDMPGRNIAWSLAFSPDGRTLAGLAYSLPARGVRDTQVRFEAVALRANPEQLILWELPGYRVITTFPLKK